MNNNTHIWCPISQTYVPVNYDNIKTKMKKNNPNNEPVGHFTGRCKNCGSKNLWDDNHAYGCNDCKEIYIT